MKEGLDSMIPRNNLNILPFIKHGAQNERLVDICDTCHAGVGVLGILPETCYQLFESQKRSCLRGHRCGNRGSCGSVSCQLQAGSQCKRHNVCDSHRNSGLDGRPLLHFCSQQGRNIRRCHHNSPLSPDYDSTCISDTEGAGNVETGCGHDFCICRNDTPLLVTHYGLQTI